MVMNDMMNWKDFEGCSYGLIGNLSAIQMGVRRD
jgi:hypothetical protein